MISFASLASLVALIPGGGAAAGGIASAFAALLRCTTCLKIAGVALLCGWIALHVHRVDIAACDGRIETRIEDARRQAQAAAVKRDAAIRADLETSYGPALTAQRALTQSLKDKVEQYETSRAAAAAKPRTKQGQPPPVAGCRLGDAAGLLQHRGPDKAAAPAPGGIAGYLRRHFNPD